MGQIITDTELVRMSAARIQVMSENFDVTPKYMTPATSKGPGITALANVGKKIDAARAALGALMENTAYYLRNTAVSYDEADKRSAEKLLRERGVLPDNGITNYRWIKE